MLTLIAAATITALATGIGALPVIALGERSQSLQPLLLGIAGGVMSVAAIQGLILPALDRGSGIEVGAGILLGVLFLLAARALLGTRTGAEGPRKTTLLVFLVLFVHSLPEGFAVGTAYATDPETLGLFIVAAISLQNIPEGTSVAIPMAAENASASKMIAAAVLSSAPQPVGAVIAFLLVETIDGLLPISFGFAAGAMLMLVAVEVLPTSLRSSRWAACGGFAAGAAAMCGAGLLLAV